MNRPPHQPYTWTYSEYARFPDDGNRYEVIDGEVLVTPAPSPRHQDVAARLLVALQQYAERNALGKFFYDIDLLLVAGQFLRPDLLFVPNSAREGITDRGMELPPGLVIEVQSPTSSSIDRVKKPRRYGDFGVPEYWVVDPDEQVVWMWRFAAGKTEAERISDRVTWQPDGASQPFVLELSSLFRPMWDMRTT
jgi:Uma2 family endonuclease